MKAVLASVAFALAMAVGHAAPLADFHRLVRTESWTERWPDSAGALETRPVTAEVWTAAFQAALDADGSLHIPARSAPYYLDGPLILKSHQTLTADARAEVRLKPGTNTCMVRNAGIKGFRDGPVPGACEPDTNIRIEGGLWTTLATSPTEANGNRRGPSSAQLPVPGTHGVILLHNVRQLVVRHLTVRESRPHAIQLGNVRDFLIEGIQLERTRHCGVQVEGPASEGVIRQIHGAAADDLVALNAWDWSNYAPSFGPIHHVLLEDLAGTPSQPAPAAAANAIRLLPGVKRFADGTVLDCSIHDITLRRIADIDEFKIYDQPNLELGRDRDFSLTIGTVRAIRFEHLTFHRPGRIELHAHADGLVIQGATIHHPLSANWHLLAIGPKSQTYRHGPDPATQWTEIFSPDRDCTVRNLQVSGVRLPGAHEDLPVGQVVRVIELQPNPDYPKTTPRGGTGKGHWIR